MQFKGSHEQLKKPERKEIRDMISRAKSYDDVDAFLGGTWNGEEEMMEIVKRIEARVRRGNEDVASEEGKGLVDLAKMLAASISYQVPPTTPALTLPPTTPPSLATTDLCSSAPDSRYDYDDDEASFEAPLSTPPDTVNPEPDALRTPRLPLNEKMMTVPAMISGRDVPTPTPTPTTSQGSGRMLA